MYDRNACDTDLTLVYILPSEGTGAGIWTRELVVLGSSQTDVLPMELPQNLESQQLCADRQQTDETVKPS